jgi:protein ImuB
MFAVIYVRQFSLQAALRHETDLRKKPVALVDPAECPPVICDRTEPAFAAGITSGLSPTQAMARCGEVIFRQRSLEQEESATAAMLQCAYAFSPHLESTGPGLCTLDLRGISPTTGWTTWAEKLQQTLGQLELATSIGLGPTPQVARHAACWGKGIELVQNPAPFIAALPVSALELSKDVAVQLQRWGIRTVGELLALGQEALTERLGLEALALLAAASSTALRPLRLVEPPEHFHESFRFEPVVETLEPLLFLLRRFVDQLCPRLALRGLVAEVLLLHLTLESGESLAFRLAIPQPTSQADVLFRTLHTYLETVRSESPIRAVGLTMLPVQAKQKQLGLFETVLSNPQQFQETLSRLAAALGPDRVGTPALENSHRPDAFRLVAPDFENAPVPVEKSEPLLPVPLPIRRFRPLHKIRPPSNKQWGMVLGPWRASGNWWDTGSWEGEEWETMDSEGQVLRLVRQPDGWFVEGLLD